VASTDPLYILYTSGTTGLPKGIVRDNGGHAVALEWSMRNVYGARPGGVFWAASDIGWVVGHSYIVCAPLLHGCTTVLYEGKPVGTPDAGAFWRVIADHDVNVMFTAPTAIRAIKREDPTEEWIRAYDLHAFRTLFLAGERTDPDTLAWAQTSLGVPVIDHWWQTESGWPIAANCLGLGRLPVKPGSPTKAVPGYDIRILDDHGDELPAGQAGAICVKLPLPPGFAPTLWRGRERFVEAYLSRYPGYYLTGDAGYLDEDGYLYVMSRIDDVINVAGHRLSTGQLEEVVSSHPDVAECAVVGLADELKGQIPLGFAVLKAGVDRPHEHVVEELIALVRERSGRWPASRQSRSSTRCPRPAPARPCAPPSARWQTASRGRYRRRSRTRPCSTTTQSSCQTWDTEERPSFRHRNALPNGGFMRKIILALIVAAALGIAAAPGGAKNTGSPPGPPEITGGPRPQSAFVVHCNATGGKSVVAINSNGLHGNGVGPCP
jgi:propionyl-CoA synthetase